MGHGQITRVLFSLFRIILKTQDNNNPKIIIHPPMNNIPIGEGDSRYIIPIRPPIKHPPALAP